MEVDLPMQAGYARSHFNYFRQSWIRYYEFLQKQKDYQKAEAAMDTYNRLASYMVQIAPPRTLIFTSKDIPQDLAIRTEGQVPEGIFDSWLPKRQDIKESKPHNKRSGRIKLANTENIPEFDQKKIDEDAARILGITTKADRKAEQVIPDNPPQDPTSNKYGLPIGPPPGFEDKKD
jgi:hypothetical protein